jgi:hypothetical protein
MENHISEVHEKAENYICEICGKILLSELGLKYHVDRGHKKEEIKVRKNSNSQIKTLKL